MPLTSNVCDGKHGCCVTVPQGFILQGEEYDELGSVASQLHDVIIGASDDETQSMVYGAGGPLSEGGDTDAGFTDASERFRPSSSQGSVSDFGTRSPNHH